MRLLLELVAIYLLFKLIFGLLIPLWKMGTSLKNNIRATQDTTTKQQKETPTKKNKKPIGDYIDFEEVKPTQK